jgi:hypothetical protein
MGGITSSLPRTITFSGIRGPEGNVLIAPHSNLIFAFRVFPLCLSGSHNKWAFTHAFLYGTEDGR